MADNSDLQLLQCWRALYLIGVYMRHRFRH